MNRQFFSVYVLIFFADFAVASRSSEKGVGQWVTISTQKACELNGESIHKVGTRGFVDSLRACRVACLLHSTCIAVDYYAETKVCHFYENSCILPLAERDGSCSHHLSRSAEFKAIDYGAACESNDEGIVAMKNASLQAISSLENCQDACLHRANCRAVDYYRHTGFCSFYEIPCMLPKAKHDGASSYKIVKHFEERTIVDVKRDLLSQAKKEKSWHVINASHSCERNDEGIVPINGSSRTVDSVQSCQNLCNLHETCAAIDYYRATKYCIFYTEPCMRPMASHNHPISMRYKLDESAWITIDAKKACENNKEGVKRMEPYNVSGRAEASLKNCQQACLNRLGCIAVDYYRNTTWCNFYSEACVTPLSTSDGASSYRLMRTPGPGKPAPVASKLVDNMIAQASSVVHTKVTGSKEGESHAHSWKETVTSPPPTPHSNPEMTEHHHEKEM